MYSSIALKVDTTHLTPEEVAERVIEVGGILERTSGGTSGG